MITKELLQKFCADELEKYHISKPFTVGEFSYATNGHIIVQVPKIEGIPESAEGQPGARVEALIADGVKDLSFAARRFLIEDPVRKTLKCDCSSHACPTCCCADNCEDCEDGVIIEERRKEVVIDGISFDPWYIELMQSLSGLEISVARAGKPLAFKFEGGFGLLMPRAWTGHDYFRFR